MTDFASQGKTRNMNPVDLNNLKTHQAYYTALSHSSSAKGTIILQGFDSRKMTGGASGALREDFTVPHIVQLDSSGVRVVHPSSPGVQVFFFLVVVQPNYNTNFRQTPGELWIEFS